MRLIDANALIREAKRRSEAYKLRGLSKAIANMVQDMTIYAPYPYEMRWIPCSERMPEMHKEELDVGIYYTSDAVLFSAADRVHVGFCVRYNNELFWEMQDGETCANVTAWMPIPEAYEEE